MSFMSFLCFLSSELHTVYSLLCQIGKTEKVRHALWNFCIMDMFNESWLASTPQVANTRTVSSCIEVSASLVARYDYEYDYEY